MKTLNYKEMIGKESNIPISIDAQNREKKLENQAVVVQHQNSTVNKIVMLAPGIFEIESKKGDSDAEIISAGIHGNEMVGVNHTDKLLKEVFEGTIDVNKNMMVIYGNLLALNKSRGGNTCGNYKDNLNRLFNQGLWENIENYEQLRANIIMQAITRACNSNGEQVHIDLHQSFNVPTINQVRGINDFNGFDYSFAIIGGLEHDIMKTLKWIQEKFSDVLAGVVFNGKENIIATRTFSGHTANLGMQSGTFEMGKIGHNGSETFTPQLFRSIKERIEGDYVKQSSKIDIWKTGQGIIKTHDNFSFLDKNGEKTSIPPTDFMPTSELVSIQNGVIDKLGNPNNRLLFSNCTVPIGDRTAVEVEPLYIDGISHN